MPYGPNGDEPVTLALGEDYPELRQSVHKICEKYPGAYWRKLEAEQAYPTEFIAELTQGGFLASLIPEEYGGSGLPLRAAAVILEEINASGCTASQGHAQMYIMGTVLRHGSEEQKQGYLPKIASGELRLQAFGVTEPTTGSDTTKLKTRAVRQGNQYVINGQKVWTSRARHSDLMLLLARTTPVDEVKRRTDGLSVFLIDLRNLTGLEVRPLRMMMNHSTNALFFDDVEIPADSLIGEEGAGFAYILDGMNAERILVGSESIGDGRWFVDKAVAYSSQRVVFGRPIGTNQGVQFPIAKGHTTLEAAALMRDKAAALFDAGQPCGPEANMAKYLAAEAAWEAANACIDCHGGDGVARGDDGGRQVRPGRPPQNPPGHKQPPLPHVRAHGPG